MIIYFVPNISDQGPRTCIQVALGDMSSYGWS